MSSYRVSVGRATTRVKTFQEVGPVVMEALTSFLAQDPEAVARDAMVANHAFDNGAVQHSLDSHGTWRMDVTVHGEPVPVVVVKVKAVAVRAWLGLGPRS